MRKISLQWRLTILTTVLITVLCGCLTFFLYKNGVYYIDTLQETVTDQGTTPEAVYIDIPDNEWTAAVIRRVQALIGITGRKACAGGFVRQV